jgi:hypothetical protein
MDIKKFPPEYEYQGYYKDTIPVLSPPFVEISKPKTPPVFTSIII